MVIPEWSDYEIAADALWQALVNDTLEEWLCQYPEYINSDNRPARTVGTESDATATEQAAG